MVECNACDNEASGTCMVCDISVCDDHYCLMTCESNNCMADVCIACAKTNQSDNGPCCDDCSSTTTCDCGEWEDDMSSCEGCGELKCDFNCLTYCSNCSRSWCGNCGGDWEEFRGDTVCSGCKEGLQGALEDHFAAGAEHDQWNEGQG